MMSNILVIKSDNTSFDKIINDNIRKHCDVITLSEIKNSNLAIVSFINILIWLVKEIKTIRKYRLIIIFDAYYLTALLWLVKKHLCRLIIWHWNTESWIRGVEGNFLKIFSEQWTFDNGDSIKYNWHLNTQFYFISSGIVKEVPRNVAFFVGQDKGRAKTLELISKYCEKAGLQIKFSLVVRDSQKYRNIKWAVSKYIDYSEIVNNLIKSKVVIDLVKPHQQGLTLRCTEALMFKKKIITNNKNIEKEKLYNKNNIFIINKDPWDDLINFINTPFQDSEEIREYYDFKIWLDRFFC